MTDRELIELAARAAGYHGVEHQKGLGLVAIGQPEKANMLFNPLTSDADAFRLAVKLRISVQPETNHVVAITKSEHVVMLPGKDDIYTATRRAITRAAAEIGRGMV